MFKQKNLFSIVLFVCSLAVTNAVTFEDYPLGCYSIMWNSSNNPYTDAERDSIMAIISRMGYNIAQVENREDESLTGMLNRLSTYHLKAIIEDKDYPTGGAQITEYNKYNTNALTTSSYLKFEAEYSGGNDIDGGTMDFNWYCSHDEYNGDMPRVGYWDNDGPIESWICLSWRYKSRLCLH